jgi:serine/threonine-protein kinase
MAGGFLVGFIVIALVFFRDEGDAPELRVPRVIGLALSDAQRRLASAGLAAAIGSSRPTNDVPQLTVLSQTPEVGAMVPAGSAVTLDVSEAIPTAAIPNVAGLSQQDASNALAAVGLAVGTLTEQPADAAEGIVLSTVPPAGQVVTRGGQVGLVVSSGQQSVIAPDLVGNTLTSARSLIEQLGLVIAPIEYDPQSSLTSGTVVAQTPAAGSTILLGGVIALRVAGRQP